MSRPQANCIYCGKPGRSKEHYWGKWLAKELPFQSLSSFHTISRVDPELGKMTHTKGPLTRQGSIYNQQIKGPCRSCNMGWMKRANERAREVILKLVREGPWYMSSEERIVFARWAIMLSMTYEFADVHTLVTPQIERESLSRNLLPPENWGVFIAPYEGARWREQINHRVVAFPDEHGKLPARPDSQNNVFGLGKTVVNTVNGRILDHVSPHLWAFDHNLYCVWPLIATIRPTTLNDECVDDLATLGTGVIFE